MPKGNDVGVVVADVVGVECQLATRKESAR
jgi:hypothetical protein